MRRMILQVEPFKPSDEMALNDCLMEDMMIGHPDMPTFARAHKDLGMAFTVKDKNVIVGCGGAMQLFEGTGEVWISIPKWITYYKKELVHYSKMILDICVRDMNLHRIQCIIRSDFADGIPFARFLGFEREGLLRSFTPDRVDCFMYGKVI